MRKIAQKILLNENNSNVDKNNKHFYVSSNSSYFDSYSHPGIHYDMLSVRNYFKLVNNFKFITS